MINNILKRELSKEDKTHRLFDHQKASDLCELSKILKEKDKELLLVEFTNKELDEVIGTILQDGKEESQKRAEQYIALKLIQELSKKDSELSTDKVEVILEEFKHSDKYHEDKYPSLEEAMLLIEMNESIKRVHIILNGIRSAIICEGLIPMLNDEVDFGTSIYNSPNRFYPSVINDNGNKTYLTNKYKFIIFDEDMEGEPSFKLLKGKYNVKV